MTNYQNKALISIQSDTSPLVGDISLTDSSFTMFCFLLSSNKLKIDTVIERAQHRFHMIG